MCRARREAEHKESSHQGNPSSTAMIHSWSSVATHLGILESDLKALCEGDPRHLTRLGIVSIDDSHPPEDTVLPGNSRGGDATSIPFPKPNRIPCTDPVTPFEGQTIPKSLIGRSFKFHQIVTSAKRRRDLIIWQRRVARDFARARSWRRNSSRPDRDLTGWRRHQSHPIVIEPEHVAPWAVGYKWDCSDPDKCVLVDDSDVDLATINAQFFVDSCGESYQKLHGHKFPDQELLHCLQYGARLKSDFKWCAVICPPHLSGYRFLDEVSDGVEKEIEDGWLKPSDHLPFIPAHVAAFGAVPKKNKWPVVPRRTADLSYPHGDQCVNDNIDYKQDFPELRFLRLRDVTKAAAVLEEAHERVAKVDPLAAKWLRPTGFAADLQGYFNQFLMARSEHHLQGMFWPARGGTSQYLTSEVLQFGSRVGPSYGQRTANVLDVLFMDRMAAWEHDMRSRAESGEDGIAQKLWPEALRQWSDLRCEQLSVEDGRPSFAYQYVDDKIAICLGRLRAVKALLVYWDLADEAGFPVAVDKGQFGSTIHFLGLKLFLGHGVVRLDERKQRLYDEWLDRVARLSVVTEDELESLLCTITYGAVAAPAAYLRMRRSFRALRMARASRQSVTLHNVRAVTLTEAVRSDIWALRGIFQASRGGRFCEAPIVGTSVSNAGATDASRSDDGTWSGMGGVCFQSGLFWWYQLRDAELLLPIHVTEFIAELIQLRLCGHDWLDGYVEWIDNMAVVASIETQRPRDLRLIEMLLIREALVQDLNVRSRPEYIRSEDNVLADLLSRGKFAQFRSLAPQSLTHGVDLRSVTLISDLHELIDRMLYLSVGEY